ncbi:response regulator transcription factor [Ancylobacter sp. Lp-2]|uniref:LuxR C-terminal-related transcriptional regulator n=1 Tax=Ancylobacter sp. Lp-2 TaxID=2881339 RepID=UPI001E3DF3D6|nr:response regulator transcription factor [Ancylobacter sp. Lp-2]MCB4769596.1 response regulator transcription factor [Ancylobacter sp. Lp-2]
MEKGSFNASIAKAPRYLELHPRSLIGCDMDSEAPVDEEVGGVYREKNVVALIESRKLLGQCLSIALYSVDRTTEFNVYGSISDWRLSEDASATSLIIISVSDKSNDIGDGLDIKKEIAELNLHKPSVKFAILSDREAPKHVLSAMQSGAQGYIPTSISIEVIAQILHLLRFGGTFVPLNSLMIMASSSSVAESSQSRDGQIFTSQRQLMVAKALRKGIPNKVIAYQLNMCESTVKVHVRNIMKKLKAKNRTEVALLASQMFPDD